MCPKRLKVISSFSAIKVVGSPELDLKVFLSLWGRVGSGLKPGCWCRSYSVGYNSLGLGFVVGFPGGLLLVSGLKPRIPPWPKITIGLESWACFFVGPDDWDRSKAI